MSSTTKVFLGLVITLGVAVAAVAIGNDRYAEADSALAKACAGSPTTPQVENALFNARARSNDGYDPICAAPADKDDVAGELFSQRLNAARHAAPPGDIGAGARRR